MVVYPPPTLASYNQLQEQIQQQIQQNHALATQLGNMKTLMMTPAAHGDCLTPVPHETSPPPPVFNLCSFGLQQQQPSPPPQQTYQQLNMSTTDSSSSTGGGSDSKKGGSPYLEDEPDEPQPETADTSSSTVLKNFFLLARDHDAQMSEKDDIIRKLMTEKAELEQSLLTVQSSLDLMQIEREAEDAKDRAKKAERVKEEAAACLHQALAQQEKKGWDLVTKVIRAMECICCYEARPKVKVYQCIAGHLICEHCRRGLQDPVCPACTTEYTWDIRNLLAEELAQSLNLNE